MYLTNSSLRFGSVSPHYGGYYCFYHGNECFEFPVICCQFLPVHPAMKPQSLMPFVETLDPATPKKEIIIGEITKATPLLEYMSTEGAHRPTILLKIIGPEKTTSWADRIVKSGYHTKSDFQDIATGSKIIIEVKETVARFRWYERFQY